MTGYLIPGEASEYAANRIVIECAWLGIKCQHKRSRHGNPRQVAECMSSCQYIDFPPEKDWDVNDAIEIQ